MATYCEPRKKKTTPKKTKNSKCSKRTSKRITPIKRAKSGGYSRRCCPRVCRDDDDLAWINTPDSNSVSETWSETTRQEDMVSDQKQAAAHMAATQKEAWRQADKAAVQEEERQVALAEAQRRRTDKASSQAAQQQAQRRRADEALDEERAVAVQAAAVQEEARQAALAEAQRRRAHEERVAAVQAAAVQEGARQAALAEAQRRRAEAEALKESRSQQAQAAAVQEEARQRRAEEASRQAAAALEAKEQAQKAAASRGEALSLFGEIKAYIVNKLNTDNMAVLSSISKIQKDDGTYDLAAIDDALVAIQGHYNTNDTREDRQTLYTIYAARILIENAEQLVENYNRVIQNARRLFPKFRLIRPTHNRIFGHLASVQCTLKRCSDEEIEEEMDKYTLKAEGISDDDLQHRLAYFKRYYQTKDIDTPNGQARALGDNSWVSPSTVLSTNLAKMINYEKYTGNAFVGVNAIMRSDKHINRDMDDMVAAFSRFAHHLVIPMYAKDDLVIYRGDGLTTSEQTQTTMGFYSGGLSPLDMGKFVKDGGRMIQINIPKGTPLLPAIVGRQDEGEIIILPGTVLEKQSQMTLNSGHYAEYTVVSHPPRLSELEEATIFVNSIAKLYNDEITSYKSRGPGTKAERLEFVNRLPAANAPTPGEAKEFAFNLVNSKYHGNW